MSGASVGLTAARFLYPTFAVASIIVFTYVAIPYIRQTEKTNRTINKHSGKTNSIEKQQVRSV